MLGSAAEDNVYSMQQKTSLEENTHIIEEHCDLKKHLLDTSLIQTPKKNTKNIQENTRLKIL